MACGKAILSTPVGGMPDPVEDGVNGLLVKAGDIKELSNAISKFIRGDHLSSGVASFLQKSIMPG